MSQKPFEYSIFIGRFQPFHLAHYELVKEALAKADTAIVILGSYKKASSPKNPFTGEERETMMRLALTAEENARVKVIYMRDYFNDNLWIADLTQQVSEITGDSDSVVLIGHAHDHSSYYLKLFPEWKTHLMPNLDEFPHATEIRYLYFTHDAAYKKHLPAATAQYMEEFKKTDKFKFLKGYFDSVRKAKEEWSGSPFPVVFHTVDAVVLKSGHVLCVRRGKAYGKGQIALPGGFLDVEKHETLRTGAVRELKEETAIALSKEDLDKAIVTSQTFDHPDRSERGRTITQAFFFNLGSGPLPKVKGSDDADKAWWMPLRELYNREEEFFEDHFHIISYFVNKSF